MPLPPPPGVQTGPVTDQGSGDIGVKILLTDMDDPQIPAFTRTSADYPVVEVTGGVRSTITVRCDGATPGSVSRDLTRAERQAVNVDPYSTVLTVSDFTSLPSNPTFDVTFVAALEIVPGSGQPPSATGNLTATHSGGFAT